MDEPDDDEVMSTSYTSEDEDRNSTDSSIAVTGIAGSFVPSNKKSLIWNYFKHTTPLKASCNACSTKISCSAGKGRGSSTSALRKHLKAKHTDKHSDLLKSEASQVRVKDPKQPTLECTLAKKRCWDIDDPKSVRIHYSIGEMIATDNQPFSIVEDIGFRRDRYLTSPQYQIPSRSYFTKTIIPDIYERCKLKIIKQLEKAEAISTTTDIWTCSQNNESFISLTCHWITNDMEFKHYVLNSKHFPGTHSAENISQIFRDMLTDWKVDGKIHLVVRDNGANIVRGIEDSGLSGAPCFIHTLQLVINDCINSQRAVQDMISVSRKVVSHFNKSSIASNKFKEIQNSLNLKPKKLIQDVQTRWNSTYYMLERLLELKNPIAIFSSDNGITNLTTNQWKLLESTLSLLQPFEEITKIISSSESHISEVLPFIMTIKEYLNSESQNQYGVGTMISELTKSITRRFEGLNANANYVIATFLDPRFKALFLSSASAALAQNVILEETKELEMLQPIGESHELEISESSPKPSTSSHKNIWDCFNKISKQSSVLNSNTTAGFNVDVVEAEITSYLALHVIDRKENPLEWWKINMATFPHLSQLVKKYLSAPASSVYSERLFSEKGNIYEDHRNRMLPKNGEMLAFIHHNLKYLKYEY